jgi:c-di-GMP-binding flagellar brake protein YcgR
MEKEEPTTRSRYGIVNFERRKFPRLNVDLPVEYNREESFSLGGRTINVSEGGLLIHFPERMEIGQRLNVKISFISGQALSTIEAVVDVVWVEVGYDVEWADYRTGVKFIDISSDDLAKLKQFLTVLSQPSYPKE